MSNVMSQNQFVTLFILRLHDDATVFNTLEPKYENTVNKAFKVLEELHKHGLVPVSLEQIILCKDEEYDQFFFYDKETLKTSVLIKSNKDWCEFVTDVENTTCHVFIWLNGLLYLDIKCHLV